jgi:hypothetical protein
LLTAGVFGLGFELDELKRNPFLNPPNVDGWEFVVDLAVGSFLS